MTQGAPAQRRATPGWSIASGPMDVANVMVMRKVPVMWLKLPFLVAFLTSRQVGRDYGVGLIGKLRIIVAFHRNNRRVETLSRIVEHLELADALLSVPPSVEGAVGECGCSQGSSTVHLSLLCAMVGRRLIVCDSFQGLLEPSEHDRGHVAPHPATRRRIARGQFAASFDLVKDNLISCGSL